jgi:hypothetical protein
MAERRTRCYHPQMASLLSTFILPVAAGAVAIVIAMIAVWAMGR